MPYKDPAVQAAYKARWHQENKERRRKKLDERKQSWKEQVDLIKANNTCVDCNLYYPPWVMQFDHVRGKKFKEVSRLIADKQFSKIFEEIEKCELVCANCHADRTYRRIVNK